jgi:hypothetical protein
MVMNMNDPETTTQDRPNARSLFEWFDRQHLETEWKLTYDEQLTLLGNIDPASYTEWKEQSLSDKPVSLPEKVLKRLLLLKMFDQYLSIIAPENKDSLHKKWFCTPNSNPAFEGLSIKDFLLQKNSDDAFEVVESYLVGAVSGTYT